MLKFRVQKKSYPCLDFAEVVELFLLIIRLLIEQEGKIVGISRAWELNKSKIIGIQIQRGNR